MALAGLPWLALLAAAGAWFWVGSPALAGAAFLVGTGLTAAAAVWTARRRAATLSRLTAQAQALASDSAAPLEFNAPAGGDPALADFAAALNLLLASVQQRLGEGDRLRAELETLLDQMPDGLLVLDSEGTVTSANPAAQTLLDLEGPSPGKLLLQGLPSYSVEALLRSVLSGERDRGAVEFRSPDEARRPLRALVARLPGEAGQGVCILVQDLTEIRRVDEMRRDFIANVSHEVRTPLASIRALAETLLLRGRGQPELVVDLSQRLVGECERLGSLVDDLLSLSELESGRRELRLELIQAGELLDSLAREFGPMAEKNRQTLRLRPAPEAAVWADRPALDQALSNLLTNAVKYTPAAGEIVLAAELRGDSVEFSVADTGPGIAAEEQTRIFERFYRVDRARSREVGGTGLGLSIVKHLMESLGGEVRLESVVGEGSRFILTLPRAVREE